MSLSSLLMPGISEHLLGEARLQAQRARAERRRLAAGQAHQLHYFHQLDDPLSALAGASLHRLLARYEVVLQAHLVGPPSDAMAPDRLRLQAHSRVDAQRLAQRLQLDFRDPGQQPSAERVTRAQAALLKSIDTGEFASRVGAVSAWLWAPSSPASDHPDILLTDAATVAQVATHLRVSDALRQRFGHATGASFYYAGEWYWGVDRLYHLERRLRSLGALRLGADADDLFPLSTDLSNPIALHNPPAIDFFFSLRSPYSAIVVPRVFELARLTGAQVRLRYVLPMVMRGLPVPRHKRMYIARDAAREARARQIPFGRINDPVGRPTERGLALLHWAEREGRGPAYLQSFVHGVWAEGLDAGSARGLRRIVERAGLNWSQAQAPLKSERWRAVAEANRLELLAHGLWGVPSFSVGDCTVWGQDRLWAVQEALLRQADHPASGDAPSHPPGSPENSAAKPPASARFGL